MLFMPMKSEPGAVATRFFFLAMRQNNWIRPSRYRPRFRLVLPKPSPATRGLDRGDVDLFHFHHRLKHALGHGGIGIGDPFG